MNSTLYSFRLFLFTMATSVCVTNSSLADEDFRKMVPSSAMAAVFFQPKDALAQPGMELVPREVITAFGKQELGFDPCEINQIVALVDSFSDLEMPPHFAVVIQFDSPQEISNLVIEKLGLTPGKLNGMTAYHGESGLGEVLLQKDEKTFIFGIEPFVKKTLSAKGAKSGLIEQIDDTPPDGHMNVYLSIEPVRSLIKQEFPPADQVPPPFRDFLRLPDLIESLSLNLSLARNGESQFQLNALDKKGADEITNIVRTGIATAKQFILAQMVNELQDEDRVLREAMLAYANRIGDFFEQQFQPQVTGRSLVMDLNSDDSTQLANAGTIGVLVAMLLPAVQQAREAARRTSAANNLRQLALAALNYESVHRKFPAQANYSPDGKPLLSWRVHVLPFIEEQALYRKFKLDEPWDSPHNIQLLDQMPAMYQGPNSVHTNRSSFLGISGKGTMFDGDKSARFGRIMDGSSNTIFFVEVNDEAAVEWTKPGDYELNLEDPTRGLTGNRPGGFNAAFVDGSVQFIDLSYPADVYRRLMLIADGEVTPDIR